MPYRTYPLTKEVHILEAGKLFQNPNPLHKSESRIEKGLVVIPYKEQSFSDIAALLTRNPYLARKKNQ
jgi:hypothetical protein